MINLKDEELAELKAILHKHIPNITVWLFGSRITTQIKPYSDIDLAIISNKPLSTMTVTLLKNEFTESDLPYNIDLVEWALTDKSFRKIIQQRHEVIQTAS